VALLAVSRIGPTPRLLVWVMELLSGEESRESRAGGPVDHSADLVALQQAWRRMSEMINLGEARIHAAPSESPFKRLTINREAS
jgi:hypothetical protein